MTDETPTLQHLRAIDQKLDRLDVILRGGFEVIAGQLAAIDARLDRIERRLKDDIL